MVHDTVTSDGASQATVSNTIDVDGSQGFFERAFSKLSLSRDVLIESGLYFGCGFIAGFLCKRFSNYLFTLAVIIVALTALHYAELITLTVNTSKIMQMLGLPYIPFNISLVELSFSWIKNNGRISLSFVGGFVAGVWIA